MFLSHVHSFRGVAIVGIVGAHSLHNFGWSDGSLAFRIFETLCNQSSIWFFFIAGLLFQHLSSRFQTRKYYVSKLRNVITPYLILSIPALVVFTQFLPQNSVPNWFYEQPLSLQILGFLATGKHLEPFWFVPTISLLYLLGPLLLYLDRRPVAYLSLPVFAVLSAYLGRDGLLSEMNLGGMYSPFSKALYLFSVYYFGMLCGRYHNEMLAFTRRFEVLLWAIAVGAFVANVEYYGEQVYFLYIFKVVTCPLMLLQLLRIDGFVKDRLYFVGDVSFGIFFLHGYFLGGVKLVMDRLSGSEVFSPNVFSYLGFVGVVVGVCCLLLWIAKRIFGARSRLLVGC